MSRYNKDIYEKKIHGSDNLTFNTNYGLSVKTTPAVSNFTAGQCVGEILKVGTGSTTAGQLYFLWTDSVWYTTDSDDPLWSGAVLLGVAVGTNPSTDGMLLRGLVRVDSSNIQGTPAVGRQVYVSEENGKFDFTAPSGAGTAVRVVGHCLEIRASDILLMFDPSRDYITI